MSTMPLSADAGEPNGSSPYDERALACAVGVLDLGREAPEDVTVLTDEELVALDGTETLQVTALPYLDQHAPSGAERERLARTAMRSLMVRHQVVSEIDAAEFEERPLADERLLDVTPEPRLTGALVLRRTSRILFMFEREVSRGMHRLYYYPHDGDVVLEEEVTADGVHMFTVLPQASVPARVRHLIDQAGVAGEDGPARTLRSAEVEADPDLGPRLADTRALTIGTMISRRDDTAMRVLFHMTGSEVLSGQPSEDGQEVTLMATSSASIEAIVTDLFTAAGDTADAGEALA